MPLDATATCLVGHAHRPSLFLLRPLCVSSLPPCRYARTHFPSTRYLDYAITVEEYTLQKVGRITHRGEGFTVPL